MCQTVWIQIRTDILSVLIWVQTVCKGYQQTTKVASSKERVKVLDLYRANVLFRFLSEHDSCAILKCSYRRYFKFLTT